MRRGWPLLLLPWLAGCAAAGHQLRHALGSRESRLAADVVIERDDFGVPRVTGRSTAAAAFGVAYAQAEDHYAELEDGYIRALGWAAHYWGERYLADDLVRLALRANERAVAEYAAESAAVQQLCAGYAAGLNYYLRTHAGAPRKLIARYEPWMVLARARSLELQADTARPRLSELAVIAGAPTAGHDPGGEPGAAPVAVAVPAGRSASGHALLLSALDVPFSGPDQAYELQLLDGAGLQLAGFARLGLPLPESGHNAHVAWAHARTGAAQVDIAPLWFDRADTLRYRSASGDGRAEVVRDSLRVNTAGGVVWRSYSFLRTPLGTAFARRGDTTWVARLRVEEQGSVLSHWYGVSKATSLTDVLAALTRAPLAQYQTLAADDAGRTLLVRDGQAVDSGVIALGMAVPPRDSAWTAATLRLLLFGARVAGVADEIAGLVFEWEQVGGTQPRRAFAQDSSIELLRRWDGRMDTTSVAATLYVRWQQQLARGAHAGAFVRFRALEDAVAGLRRDWGREHVAWGEANRLQRAAGERFSSQGMSLALPGGPPEVRSPLMNRSGSVGEAKRYAVSGTGAVLLVELSAPLVSSSVQVFGSSGDSASTHWFDQAARFVRGELKPLSAARPRERYHPGSRARPLPVETGSTPGP